MKSVLKSIILCLLITSCVPVEKEGFVPLFDGKSLNGWVSARSKEQGDYGPFSVNEKEKPFMSMLNKSRDPSKRMIVLLPN